MTTVKKAKGLSKKGILQLADDLIAHKKQYDQDVFGRVTDCGTFACMAGLCLWREVGTREFKKLAKNWSVPCNGLEMCKPAGYAQLGIQKSYWSDLAQIFLDIRYWPEDLQEEYNSNGPTWRVISALKALQRLHPDGSIDENPNAVHTRIPQLKALLAAEAKKAKKVAKT